MRSPQFVQIDNSQLTRKLMENSQAKRLPLTGQWELTCRCNLKCVMCYTEPFDTPERIRNELTTGEIIRILDELERAGCLELCLTGGEPLTRPDFMEIYDAAHKRGFLVTVFTNGTLITEKVVDCWAIARPKSVEISLHGVSATVFDRVTQVSGSLKRCLKAIELLLAQEIPLVLKTTGLTANRDEVLAVKRYVDSLGEGVTWQFGQYLRNDLAQTGSPFQFQLTEEELWNIEREDPQLSDAKSEEAMRLQSANQTCGGGRSSFHIDAYGQLQLCSNNRRACYDLRTGSFWKGFYELLPTFPCPQQALVPHPELLPEAKGSFVKR